ncbi:hypothetical protein BFF78_23905 [Streptomyces fodineus]|uniref:Uncharacterized protein n=1 Tax=Streptomyces fodineus TaxID=1904616 RepID=A0A1D7YNX2_9ACTN|nr:hypothetical protein BFF78_23905 [Streptomyces fodineus]
MNAAQLPTAGLLWWIWSTSQDQYETGYGGAFGILCLLMFAPLLLPFLGLLLSAVLTLPAAVLARAAFRRFGGPEWSRRVLGAAATAVGWGAVTAALLHWPFVSTASVLTALGLLPALGMAYVRTRSWSRWGLWWRSALVCAGLFTLALGGGLAACATGLMPQYEPPDLTRAQLTGVWRGDDGAELRLTRDGRAEAHRLPTEANDDGTVPDGKDHGLCAGTGTWERGEDDAHRPAVLLHLDTGCGLDTHWSVSGTKAAPQLFAHLGDPDAGVVRVLDRTGD